MRSAASLNFNLSKGIDVTPNQRLKQKIEDLLNEGKTLRSIATKCGCRYQTLQHILKDNVSIPREIIPISYGLGLSPDEVWYGTVIDPDITRIVDRLKDSPKTLYAVLTLLNLTKTNDR